MSPLLSPRNHLGFSKPTLRAQIPLFLVSHSELFKDQSKLVFALTKFELERSYLIELQNPLELSDRFKTLESSKKFEKLE